MSKNSVEVERRFLPTAETPAAILNCGGRYLTEQMMVDRYVDTSDYRLVLQDCWLRRRNDVWEIKHKTERQLSLAVEKGTKLYTETTNATEIKEILKAKIGSMKDRVLTDYSPDYLLANNVVSVFSQLTTHRKTFHLNDVTISIDHIAEIDYTVGEMEVMICNDNEFDNAQKKIGAVAALLNISCEAKVIGKLIKFISHHRPELWEKLKQGIRKE